MINNTIICRIGVLQLGEWHFYYLWAFYNNCYQTNLFVFFSLSNIVLGRRQ